MVCARENEAGELRPIGSSAVTAPQVKSNSQGWRRSRSMTIGRRTTSTIPTVTVEGGRLRYFSKPSFFRSATKRGSERSGSKILSRPSQPSH